MTRYIMRGCPRCGGDLYVNEQYYRRDDWQCLQCGRYRHQPDPQSTDNEILTRRPAQFSDQPDRIGRSAENSI